MLFNSLEYFIFLPTVLFLYFLFPHKWQNRLLLIGSYIFYGWWDWRFLTLIFISTLTDFYCGIKIHEAKTLKKRKFFLIFSVVVNLTILGFFKYWNFFIESFVSVLSLTGLQFNYSTLNIILPVGISFYTFQTMTYSIDIYRGNLNPTYNFFNFGLFVSYFPQLVAGPIERAKRLLPQIENQRHFNFDTFLRGLNLIFWGLFKKIFVADNLGIMVDEIYNNPSSGGIEYIIASLAFAFQIYGDFSGYSDVARGTSKCFGIELMHNFKQPYFAIDPSDFWRRWHISLSTWLKDYLYIPLGGSRGNHAETYRNLMLTMLLGGLWHGAAWNFVLWGAYHGLLLCIFRPLRGYFDHLLHDKRYLIRRFFHIFIMFNLTWVGWVFFRAQSVHQIVLIFKSMLNVFHETQFPREYFFKLIFFSSIPLLVMTYHYLSQNGFLEAIKRSTIKLDRIYYLPVKSAAYGILTYLLCLYGSKAQSFIYFQF